MIYLAGIAITFFLAFILLGKKGKTFSDKVLFIWFIAIGIHLSLVYLPFTAPKYNYPFLLGLYLPFPLLHGPFLLLYTSAVTNQFTSWKIFVPHFLPGLMVLFCFSDFFLLPPEAKVRVFENKGLGYEGGISVYAFFVKISGIIYVVWSLLSLRRHRKNIAEQFSNTDKINLYWLKYLIAGVAVVWVFVLFGKSSHLYFAAVTFVISMGYFGIHQAGVFTLSTSENDAKNPFGDKTGAVDGDQKNEKIKYGKSGLSEETAAGIYTSLVQIMKEKELFTNPDLTLVDLAQTLQVHPNNLSQVINTFEGKNFYDYINAQRIEKFIAVAKIPENKRFTIVSLAYDCGFNSKSSFNKYFKKMTQQTPSQFMNTL